MRTLVLLLAFSLLAALTPTAVAEHEGGSAHQDEGTQDPDEPYYVKADVHPPRAPGDHSRESECGGDKAPDGFARSTSYTLGQIKVEDSFTPEGPRYSFAHLIPTCIIVDTGGLSACPGMLQCGASSHDPLGARVTYNMSSGNVTLVSWAMSFAGNSGLGLKFDCRDCPPPSLQ